MKKSLNILPAEPNRDTTWRIQKKVKFLSLVEIITNDQDYTQLQRTYYSFKKKPKTRMQVARETGINRANICWYVADLLKAKKIVLIKIDRCPITKHKAQFLSTNKDLIKKMRQKQPTLFKVSQYQLIQFWWKMSKSTVQ